MVEGGGSGGSGGRGSGAAAVLTPIISQRIFLF
jgi:hypothetical protein